MIPGAWFLSVRCNAGDIVVFYHPANPVLHLVKRVVGVPKDRIRL